MLSFAEGALADLGSVMTGRARKTSHAGKSGRAALHSYRRRRRGGGAGSRGDCSHDAVHAAFCGLERPAGETLEVPYSRHLNERDKL